MKQKINAYSNRFIDMKQLFTILIFYKPYVVWSLIVNICIAIICPAIISAITTKLLLTIFIWFLVKETRVKHKLYFYNKLGISTIKLFSILFLIDISFTIGFLEVIKEYV